MNEEFEQGRTWGQFTERYADDGSDDDRDRTNALAKMIDAVDRSADLDVESLTLSEIRKALTDGWLSAYARV